MDTVKEIVLTLTEALGAGILAGMTVMVLGGIFGVLLTRVHDKRGTKPDSSWLVIWTLLVGLAVVGTFGMIIGWRLAG